MIPNGNQTLKLKQHYRRTNEKVKEMNEISEEVR